MMNQIFYWKKYINKFLCTFLYLYVMEDSFYND